MVENLSGHLANRKAVKLIYGGKEMELSTKELTAVNQASAFTSW